MTDMTLVNNLKINDLVNLKREARPYRMGGFVDHSCLVGGMDDTMIVKSKRKVTNGIKVHFRNTDGTGYAIVFHDKCDVVLTRVL